MKTDSIGRRVRDKAQPTGYNRRMTPRIIEIFKYLHRHGGRLPTSFIHDFEKDTYRDKNRMQVLLKDLYHEKPQYLWRDWKQQETRDPEYNELVHELNKNSIELLKDEGWYSEYAPTMHGSYKHQVMLSCISASFELNCKKEGLGYTPQHELLEKLGHDHTIIIDNDKVTPDEVFAISKQGKEYLLFLEVDRGTEATESQNFNRKSWTRSIKQYHQVIAGRKYKEHFNTTSPALLLIITVSKSKQEGILKVIKEEFPQGCNFILVHYMPEFGRAFHPPRQLDLLTIPWQRAGYPPMPLVDKPIA